VRSLRGRAAADGRRGGAGQRHDRATGATCGHPQHDAPATLSAWQKADLSARVTGYVRDMRVDKGDEVKRGQVLATLDVPDLVHGLSAADAQALEAKGKIGEAERNLELQRATLARLEAAHKEDPRAVTGQELDVARKKAEAADAALGVARSGLDRAAATRAGGKTLLRFGVLEAPFPGVITARNVDTGALVRAAGEPLLSIADTAIIRVYVHVPDTEVGHVAAGRAATLTVDAYPGRKFSAKVTRLSRALDPATRTMKIEIDLANTDRALYPGMFGRVRLELDTHPEALVVPLVAVTRQKDKAFVFVARDGKARRIPIQLGTESGDDVEVSSGVAPDDALLVARAALAEGTPVIIAAAK